MSDGLNFIDRLFVLQRKLGMTHADMSFATGIPALTFSKLYTTRQDSLKLSQLLALCSFVASHGVSLEWLLLGRGALSIQFPHRDVAETRHVNTPSKPDACAQENRTDATDMDVNPGDADAAD